MLWKLNYITIWVSTSITEFERKIEEKNYGSKSLIDQEWHLALEVLTLEAAHAEREREKTPTK
jgi:hypothetical protein